MERVAPSDPVAVAAISVADGRNWQAQADWEFGPDAFLGPWLYEENRVHETDALVTEDNRQPGADVRGR